MPRVALTLALLASLAACARPARAPRTEAAAPSAPAADAAVSDLVRAALASRGAHRLAADLADRVGPRPAGSPGDAAAVEWAVATMKRLGLEGVRREAVTVPVWRRGAERAEIVGPGARPLAVTALGWSGSTGGEGVEGEVVRVESVDALAAMPDDAVRGHIVFFDVRMRRTRDAHGYGEAVGIRYAGPKAAAARGAAAVLTRSIGTDDRPHTGSTSRSLEPPIPAGALAAPDADALARAVSSGTARVRVTLTPERAGEAQSANVLGEVRGTSRPEEIVLLGAHLDSWDLGRGAVDDAAGVGAVLEAARLVAAAKPARTVRVVLFAAEESSLAGARTYAKEHAAELDRHVLAMEVDLGTDRVWSLRFLGDPARAPDFEAIARPLSAIGVATDGERGHPGADVSPLAAAGVPIVDVRQDATRYFDLHHTSADTSGALDGEALAQVTAVVAHVALAAARAEADFGRVPPELRGD